MSLPGPCGYEHAVIRYLKERLVPIADECRVDGIGNLIVTKHGGCEGPTLVLSAHTDEVGFIVRKIEANGLIRFEKLGGHDDRILLSEQVIINTVKGPLPAVIGTISAHMMKFDTPGLVRKHTELYMDAGAADREEAERLGIKSAILSPGPRPTPGRANTGFSAMASTIAAAALCSCRRWSRPTFPGCTALSISSSLYRRRSGFAARGRRRISWMPMSRSP